MLAGLWVAISPWFVTPRAPRSGNATANDLIIGRAVAAIGLLAVTGIRSMAGLQAARLRPRLADHLAVHPGCEGLHHRVDVLEQHLG